MKRIANYQRWLVVVGLMVMGSESVAKAPLDKFITCRADECPMIAPVMDTPEALHGQAVVYETSMDHRNFMHRYTIPVTIDNNGGWQHIQLDEQSFADAQAVIGFGGAFTDTAALLYQKMSPALKQAFIRSYFGREGVAYSLGRVPMASTDFSCRNRVGDTAMPTLGICDNALSKYSYADIPDNTADNFRLQIEDTDYKIPMLQAALDETYAAGFDGLTLFASPWSAPAWMKSTGEMVHGSLLDQFASIWAAHFVQFLENYLKYGIKFWGVTVQNEPDEHVIAGQGNLQTWQTMYYTAQEEAMFIKHHLGPQLAKFTKTTHIPLQLMIHDDQGLTIKDRVEIIMKDKEAAKYINGAGVHWYANFGGAYQNIDQAYTLLNKADPQQPRFVLGTEACNGYLAIDKGPSLGNWSRGESYAHDIINDLNHHVSGWTDWNLVLDMRGGPTWAKNYVDAPILVDLDKQVFYKQPMYYYFGHFSKFIRPGSRLLASRSEGPASLEEVTFRVPAHENLPETIVVVVLNRDVTGRKYYIKNVTGQREPQYINMTIPSHAIQTIIFRVSDDASLTYSPQRSKIG